MPTVDFAACLANYWFVWVIDGLGCIFSLLISLAVAYFFLKYFQFIAHGAPTPPKKDTSPFANLLSPPPDNKMPVGAWGNSNTAGAVFNTVAPR